MTQFAGIDPASAVFAQETSWIALAPPTVSAKSVFSIDISRGTELVSKNADDRLAMGSTAKIATALTVRHLALDPDLMITIESTDPVSDPLEFSNMGLQAGMEFTIEELLYGLLIPSGNDAAAALARVLGGDLPGGNTDPRQAFMNEVNRYIAELGATNSHFATPDGLEGDGEHYTTARDLALLGGLLLSDALLSEIVQQETFTVTSHGDDATELTFLNTNKRLPDQEAGLDNVIGIKTGSTSLAGGCLVIASTEGGNTIITVVLGSDLEYGTGEEGYLVDARWDDFDRINATIEQNYTWVPLAGSGAISGLADELQAWNVTLKAEGSVAAPVQKGDLRYRLELGPSGAADSKVGRVLFLTGSSVVAELPVYQQTTTT